MFMSEVSEYFFLDACLFAGQVPEVEDARPANLAELVYLNLVNEWRCNRENPFYSDVP